MDPRSPFAPKSSPGRVIQDARQCAQCGYSLRGLRTGGVCPECGTRIPLGRSSSDGLMTDAGPTYLHLIMTAAVCMGLAAPVMIIGIIWTFVESPWNEGYTVEATIAVGVAAAIWIPGVWLLTRPRPQVGASAEDERPEWRAARWSSRASQAMWLVGTPLLAFGASQFASAYSTRPIVVATGAQAAVWMGEVFWLIGFLGLAPLALYLAHLANWAQDTSLADRLRLVPVGVVLGAVLMAVMGAGAGSLKKLGVGFVAVISVSGGFMLVVFAIAQLAMALFSLGNLARWAIKSREVMLGSEARRSANVLARIEAAKAKYNQGEVHVYDAPKPAKAQGRVIAPLGESQPYELAPEEPPQKPRK